MSEKEQLLSEVQALENEIKPKRDRLREIYQQEADEVEAKRKRALLMQDSFSLDELVFAATSRCGCGAGMAYPKNIGMHGCWDCSDILLGRAKPKTDTESKQHSGAMPFAFYEIKSEGQPSANGATTRPEK